jgi:hypothetical protein
MNTIQIVNSQGQTVNYTETEITTIIQNGVDNAKYLSTLSAEVRQIRNEVRDFFSEGEWDSGEQTVNKGDVNFLLERIGCNKLTTIYRGAATISFNFEVEAESEDDARTIIEENASVQEYSFDSSNEDVSVDEIDENY